MTTLRTTPQVPLGANPSSTPVKVNGGVLWIPISWDVPGALRPGRKAPAWMIPHRWLSASRRVGPRSSPNWRKSDLPPPRALGMCGRRRVTSQRLPAEMGRINRRRRRRERAATSSEQTLHQPLDTGCFIDGGRIRIPRGCSPASHSWSCGSVPPPLASLRGGTPANFPNFQGAQ